MWKIEIEQAKSKMTYQLHDEFPLDAVILNLQEEEFPLFQRMNEDTNVSKQAVVIVSRAATCKLQLPIHSAIKCRYATS